jgi:hypothetical protein
MICKKVYIKWIDSQTDCDWTYYRERKDILPMIIHTVGFLIYENKKLIRMALSIGMNTDSSNKQFDNTVTIPKCSTIKRTKIK